jgi:hypothetical protein
MRLHRIIAPAALALAVFPAAAVGSPRLTLRAADRAADKTASTIADTWQGEDGSKIDDYDLSDCDRASRRAADCDVTYVLDDGTECDDTIHVTLNRKGRVRVESDSDDGDTQTFDDCLAPEDDPAATDDGTDDGSGGDDPATDDGSF